MRRAVITGLGVVSPLGCKLEDFWGGLRSGTSGIRAISKFDSSRVESRIAGEVAGFDPLEFLPRKELRRMDSFSQYAIGAARSAIEDSGVELEREAPERVGVVVGSGIGGLTTLEQQHTILVQKGPGRCSPFMIPEMISNMAGGLIAIRYGCRGPNYSTVSACASAAHAIVDSTRLIRNEEADMVITGGAEAPVCELGVAGFCAMRALSTRNDEPAKASRPFDAGRDGFVIAEGAGIIILEEMEHARARNARIYCEVAGFGVTCDAFHMTAPCEDGAGAAQSMELAMKQAGAGPEDVDYINAHGTSTQLNDKMETAAIKTALGEERARSVTISSTKSMTGHLLGAAAAVETAACSLAIRDGVVPPTINYETPDPECGLDYTANAAREKKVNFCLNNSLGFGGHNACIALRSV
ncbi:MAG: beta-ketoacyl-ACP synthase II [Kiritimatiellia bacterium]